MVFDAEDVAIRAGEGCKNEAQALEAVQELCEVRMDGQCSEREMVEDAGALREEQLGLGRSLRREVEGEGERRQKDQAVMIGWIN